MIVVRLDGGLGNQLFQYAFGRALAVKHGTMLYMDTIAFDSWQPNPYASKREYELDIFSIKADILTQSQRKFFFPNTSFVNRVWHKLKRMTGSYSRLYERHLGFDEDMPGKSSKNSYCIGYWQSVFYFDSIASLLVKEIVPKLTECRRDTILETEIETRKPVCVHVRRGDYVFNPITQKVHGLLTLDYYKKAVNELEKKLSEKLEYYIFSDDPAWCSEAFSWLPFSKVVNSPSPNHPCYDMYLMSRCRHFIIANSSFSWWAAWLGNSKEKRVIAPQQWFAGTTSEELQMHPKDWITI